MYWGLKSLYIQILKNKYKVEVAYVCDNRIWIDIFIPYSVYRIYKIPLNKEE